MAIVLRYADLVGAPNCPPPHKLWGSVLWMAHTDGATAVQLLPWREKKESLAYVLDGVRVTLTPPQPGWAEGLVEVARELFTRSTSGPACGVVAFDVSGVVSVWDAVVWTTGERSGVELFRVAPPRTAVLPPVGE